MVVEYSYACIDCQLLKNCSNCWNAVQHSPSLLPRHLSLSLSLSLKIEALLKAKFYADLRVVLVCARFKQAA